jgi:hypothetical protein
MLPYRYVLRWSFALVYYVSVETGLQWGDRGRKRGKKWITLAMKVF